MALLGGCFFVLYVLLVNRRNAYRYIPKEDVLNLFAIILVGAIIGAKLLHLLSLIPFILQNWSALIADKELLLSLLTGGGVFYGGLLGALLACYCYSRKYSIPFAPACALLVSGLPLFHFFGRLGCFAAGCCWGIPVSWGIPFTQSPVAPNGIPLLPIQLFEAFGNLLLFILLAILLPRMKQLSYMLPVYLLSYGTMRFVLEFWRGDSVRGVYLLSVSQWISLLLIASVIIWYISRGRNKRPPQSSPPTKSG